MGRISESRYRVVNLSKAYLEKNNFRWIRELSNSEDGNIYRYRFPVWRYQDFVTLEAEITLNYENNTVIVDVLDMHRARYAPFYHIEYGVYSTVLPIEEKIFQQLNKLGIEEITNDSDSRREVFDMPTPHRYKPRRSEKHEDKVCSER